MDIDSATPDAADLTDTIKAIDKDLKSMGVSVAKPSKPDPDAMDEDFPSDPPPLQEDALLAQQQTRARALLAKTR